MAALRKSYAPPPTRAELSNVPKALREAAQWVAWKLVWKPDKERFDKVPFNPRTHQYASVADAGTWGTHEEAVAALESGQGYNGVGFVFTATDDFCGIDLDDVRDPATGAIAAEAQAIIDAIDAFTEVSPSGTGVHMLCLGKLPAGGRKKKPVEMYDSVRFLTVTGDVLRRSGELVQRQAEVVALHAKTFGTIPEQRQRGSPAPTLPDLELLGQIARGRDSELLDLIRDGQWERRDYPSQSEADFAVCSMLARYTSDAEQIDRVFRGSALFRAKWDKKRGLSTYGRGTIEKALSASSATASAEGGRTSDELLTELNATFAVIPVGASVRIMHDLGLDPDGVPNLAFRLKQDFDLYLSNRTAPGGGKLSAWWLTHPSRRSYKGITFMPGQEVPGYLNLWTRWPVVAVPGDIRRFWDFVRDVICAGNEPLYVYMRKWFAHLIQRPWELPEVALVLHGGQGIGKNTLVRHVARLVGPHFRALVRAEQITGRFNAHLKGALLVHANEATWGGNKADAGALKSLITDATIPIEHKGVDIAQIKNCARVIVSSNEDWVVPVDLDDRRFLFTDVAETYKQNHDYFGSLEQLMQAQSAIEALMHDLSTEDIAAFNPRRKPASPFGFDQKLRSAGSVTRYVHERLQVGSLTNSLGQPNIIGWPATIEKSALHRDYVEFCQQRGERHIELESSFHRTVRFLLKGHVSDARPGSGETRRRCYQLGSLEQCRGAFEKAVDAKGAIDWEPVASAASGRATVSRVR